MYLQLIQQRAVKIRLDANLNESQEIELENSFNFTMSYLTNGKQCRAILTTDIRCKEKPDTLSISVELEGIFACENVEDDSAKKRAHVLAYTLLFPYAQYLIAHIATEAGLPPIMIKMAEIDPSTVSIQ